MSKRPLSLLLFLLVAAGAPACGGDDDTEPSDSSDPLEPPPDGEGVQFQITTTLEPGVEAEHCLFVKGPGEKMWVARDEARFDTGSHHVLLYETDYDEIPTRKEGGAEVDTSGVFDCSDGATNGWRVTRLVGGSQNATGDSMIRFPEGVAMPVRAGAVLLLNVHYINASDERIEPEARINLHTIPAEEVETEGDLLFLYNPLIKVPANGAARARGRCPVHGDITIANVQSHMHARGTGYAAMVAGEAEPFYVNQDWSNIEVKSFEPELRVPAGASLEYYCDYENSEDRTVYQGARSTDEMCMLIGSYYPADLRTSNCLDENGQEGGEWIGAGAATCAETMGCLFGIDYPSLPDPFPSMIDCLIEADPAVSRQTSDLLNCMVSMQDPAQNPATTCAPQIAACQGT